MSALLIKAGRLFDGEAAQARNHAFAALEGGRITALGAQADLGADAAQRFGRVIDLGPEATLLPGLINMHVHMSASAARDFDQDALRDSPELLSLRTAANLHEALWSGTTTVRDCGTPTAVAMTARHAVETGVLPGPRVVTCGLGITCTGGHFWYSSLEADSRAEVIAAARGQIKAGADFIKVFATYGRYALPGKDVARAQYDEALLCALTADARRLGRGVAAHAHATAGIRHCIAAGVHWMEHCTWLSPQGVRYEPDLAGQVADRGIYVSPTIFRGASKHADDPDFDPPADYALYCEYTPHWFASLREMAARGVRIVSGNDAGSPFVRFADYPGDLAFQAEGTGWSPAEVLRSATSVAAQSMGRADLGVLAPGKAADLLAVWGDPLADLWALERTALVVARGAVIRQEAAAQR